MVHRHRQLEHAVAVLAGTACLVAQQTETTRVVDLDHTTWAGPRFAQLARARSFQPRNRLRSSADRSLVFRPASSSHASSVAECLSPLPVPAAARARGNDLATFTNFRAAGRQRSFLVELWRFLPFGYLLTIAIETPILLFGLSPHHPKRRRLLAGVWLTACTYPIVVLV